MEHMERGWRLCVKVINIEYTCIVGQGKICSQFKLLTWTSFIGQFVLPIERRGWGKWGG